MNISEARHYYGLKHDLENKKWIDLARKGNFRRSPELRDIPDEAFPQTVLIVPDGQRRFAEDARLSTAAGYSLGADNLVTQLKALSHPEVPTRATIAWGFSADNWGRPEEQVDGLMTLMNNKIPEIEGIVKDIGGRFIHLGRHGARADMAEKFKDYPELIRNMNCLERDTAKNPGKVIAVAVDFGGTDQDIRTHRRAYLDGWNKDTIDEAQLWRWRDGRGVVRTADLAIRTGEEVLLSKGVGMFHSSDIGWPNGKNTYWVTFEKRFPQLTLQDTARAIRAYALQEKRLGK